MNWRSLNTAYVTALLILGGAASIGALQNIVFVHSLGRDIETTAVWVGLAVLSAAMKIRVTFTPRWYKNSFLFAAFGLALLFDVLCAFGHGAMTRGEKLEAYQTKLRERQALIDDVTRLESELAAIAVPAVPVKPASAIEAQIVGVKAAVGCGRDESRGQCAVTLAPLKTELATAVSAEKRIAENSDARRTKAGELAEARDKLRGVHEPEHPDPQAAWIARRTGLSDGSAASIQTVLGMALLEIGVIAGAIMAERAPVPAAPAPAAKPVARARNPPSGPRAQTGGNPAADAALQVFRRILDGQLQAAGVTVLDANTLLGSQRALALACGCSQPTMGRWLQYLEAAGKVTLGQQGKATKVTLTT